MSFDPVLDVRPDFQAPKVGQVDDHTFGSTGHGRGTPWKVTTGPKRTVSYSFKFGDRAELGTFRRFVAGRRGQLLGFWLPVYLRDYELTADASSGDTSLTFKQVGLSGAFSSFAQFKGLVIATWDRLECYTISAVSVADGQETVTIAPGLAGDVSADGVICGGLMFARFATDDLAYKFTDLQVSSLDADFVELPQEYVTPQTGSAPVYLYRLTRAGTVSRFAGWGVDLTIGSDTWIAADVSHSSIKTGIDFTNDGPTLSIGTDDPEHPLLALLDRNLLQDTSLEIFQTDAGTLTVDLTAPVYSGRIEDVTFGKVGVIDATISSLMLLAEQQGPQVQTQRVCVHQTYDQFCGLNAATFTTAGTIATINADPPYIEATAFGAKSTAQADPNWFALGLVVSGTETRFCVGASGNRLYLNAPFKFAIVGDSITARAGDDKRIGTCNGKFSNVANFLGFPFMPNTDPQFKALETPKQTGGKKG